MDLAEGSRPHFPMDPALAEEQSVSSIEHWRHALAIDRMILLGHSLGGYLATSYAIQYPERVSHLILVDPWGFQHMPLDATSGSAKSGFPRYIEAIMWFFGLFNPLAVIRAAGPLGPKLVNRLRPDFNRKFEDLFDDDTMTQYLYHCNAQTPSGEVGFKAMSESIGWAKRPMLDRVHLLPPSLPVTLVYGGRSWMDSATGARVAEQRPNSYTRTVVIEGAAHQVNADQPEEFNKVVQSICDSVD
uniref:AB hydrolase-1 domain-containing protein n=1 Tax=Esox lucius TaxID=8010 RepID=A0AAY5KZA2_ESOLU